MGADSLYYTTRTFATTKEVIQANKFVNSEKLNEIAKRQTVLI